MALNRKFGTIKYSDTTNEWILDDIEPHVMIKLKSVFQKISRTQQCPILVDHTPEAAVDLEWFMKRYPMRISDKDYNFIELERDSHFKTVNDLEEIMRPDYTPREFKLKNPLRKYQSQAVEIYLKNKALLVGDVVGLGKTAIGIGSLCDPDTLPAVIIVQTHLPTQWKEQIAKFTDLKVHVIKGTRPYSLPPADVYILKYSCLAGWVDTYKQKIFKSVVFDEMQELRKSDSDKYRGAKWLAKHCSYRLGLSATPVYNMGNEIYNILNLLKENCLGDRNDFIREWGAMGSEIIKNPKALGAYLREQFLFLRRTREEVGRELPVVNRITHQVSYDVAAMEKMEELASKLALKVMTGSFIERGMASRDLDIMVRQATGVAKARYVAEYVKILLEAGEPVLLAGWHRDVYDIWNKELAEYKPVMYTGSESPTQKNQAKEDFISGKSQLMMISLRSGIGLDGLQKRSSIVVFGEMDWSPQVHEQVIGRLNRDDQISQTTAIFLVSDSGSDPMMVDLLGLKASQAKGIVDPFSGVETKHSDDSRIRTLAQQIIKKRHGANSPIMEVV